MENNELSREKVIVRTSVFGIVINTLIATIKVIIGLSVSSMAILTEGVNNAADAVSSILTIAGTKLAGKQPDAKHPFGYGRVEYITSLFVGLLVFIPGIKLLVNSVELILNPVEVKISFTELYIIAVSGLLKFFLGRYMIESGKKVESSSLVGVGTECRNDSVVSLFTIASALIFIIYKLPVDAYAGLFTSSLIIKTGVEILSGTMEDLLGRPARKELADQIYLEIRNTKGIANAADLILHNYGPDSYTGSVNVEIDHKYSVGEAYSFIHALQLRIMHDYRVTMVFGIYAVDNDNEESRQLRSYIASYVRNAEYVKSFHAVYWDKKEDKIYCDLVVDYKLKDWVDLEKDFTAYMKQVYPSSLELTIETEFI